MSWLQAILLAILQGVTELFPVSSLGHAVIVPDLLNWDISRESEAFLPFLVVMHLGTAIALLIYFWRDWYDFLTAVFFRRGPEADAERKIFFRVVYATIPAVILALALQKPINALFTDPIPRIPCILLIVNGVMLFAAERIKPVASSKRLDELSVLDALIVGACQSLALFPGMSRSGATMVGGYLAGLNHEQSARFSFLTGTPIIVAAAVHEVPKLIKLEHAAKAAGAHNAINLPLSIASGVVAGVTAWFSVWFLMRWFKRHEVKGFDLYAYYCMAAGALFLTVEILAP
jgi:undecaprenyl-diphosphatase